MKNKPRENLGQRTRRFGVAVIRFYVAMPKSAVSYVVGRQLLRSGTSVGAHYREACRARSRADFISKFEVALQEIDETSYWLELAREARLASAGEIDVLLGETNELIAIFVSVVRRVKAAAQSAA